MRLGSYAGASPTDTLQLQVRHASAFPIVISQAPIRYALFCLVCARSAFGSGCNRSCG
jgi:hypothetical protein